MKTIRLLFLVPVLLTSVALSQTPEDGYKKQVGRMLKRSDAGTYTMKYFTDVAKYTFSQTSPDDKWESQYQAAIQKANNNAEKFSADFQKIISGNKEKADKERIIFKTVEYTGRLAMSPVESIPIWGPIQKEINNQIFEAAENELTNNYKKRLAYSLEQMRITNQAQYNSIIKSGSYDEVKKALDEVNFFSNTAFANVDPEYQEIIEKSQQKFLQESVKTTLERVVTDLGGQQLQIDEINTNISKLSQFTYKFAEESNKRFDVLVKSQEQLNARVDAFYNEYKTDKKALDFMQDFLYAKMNTTEKIRALNAGLLSDLSDKDRNMLKQELVLEEQKEKVINTAKDYLNSAAISIKILGDLGFGDSKLVQDISKAVNIGQAAVSAVAAYTSGNYLGAISSITGLFGSKGDDAAAQRHKQIMQRFDRIDATLNRIEVRMDQLLKTQQQMLTLQVETFQKILDLSDKIDVQHNEVMQKLTDIENALYVNRQLITNEWEGKCQACLQTISRLEMDIDEGILPQHRKLKTEYVNLKEGSFKKCEEYINTYVFYQDRASFNPDFNLTSSITDAKLAAAYNKLDTINKLSFGLLFNYTKPVGNLKSNSSFIYSLFFPSTSIDELNKKINADSILLPSNFYPVKPEIFSNIIKPEVSERHGRVVRNISFLIGLTGSNRELISWNNFTSETPPDHRNAIYELENALRLNNVAIAQQSILAGEILLPILFNETYSYKAGNGDTAKYRLCASLLDQNELLAANYANYFVGTYLQKTNRSSIQYGFAFNSKDSLTMNKLVKSSFPITYIDSADIRLSSKKLNKGWYMTIGKWIYPLPNPVQVNKTPLLQSQYLGPLLFNREKLLQQLFSYGAYEGVNAENLNYLIMKN